MRSLIKILLEITIIIAVIFVFIFFLNNYAKDSFIYLFGEPLNTIFINDVALEVSVADSPEERRQGLSGVKSLRDNEGKLFVFDSTDYQGFWMKDMNFPIDIIWIDESFKIVHIEQNVLPESYPTSYHSPVPARFVLEVNSFFTDFYQIKVGDTVGIPSSDVPPELR